MTYTLYPAKRTPVCQLKITCSIWSTVTWAHAPVTLPSPVNSVSTKLLFGSSLELQCHQFHLKIVTNAVLALGEHAEDVAFYRDFLQPMETQSTTITASASTSTHVSIQASHEYTDNVAPDVGKSIIKEVVEKMLLFSERFQSTPASAKKMLKRLNHVTTATQWETFLQTQGAGVSCVYRSGSTIRVQPTALSRRRPAVTRGSKRIAAGRPPLTALQRYWQKRRHDLSLNVSLNQPNAKQHGRAH